MVQYRPDGGETTSVVNNSNKRIPEGVYPMVAPEDNAKWRQPKIGGKVSHRGVRIHYGGKNAVTWTKGWFVISTNYEPKYNGIAYTIEESKKTVENFNRLLGASTLSYEYEYEYIDSETGRIKNRLGAKYDKSIEHTFILKTR